MATYRRKETVEVEFAQAAGTLPKTGKVYVDIGYQAGDPLITDASGSVVSIPLASFNELYEAVE